MHIWSRYWKVDRIGSANDPTMSEIPIVTIGQGTLRGSIRSDFLGGRYFSFQGIPYGQPPIGDLRFKAPRPAGKWSGTLDATKEGDCCYSRHMFQKNLVGSENCLYLNVYTKQLPISNDNDQLQPVMVWIHGGGFICGSGDSDLYGPDFLITENVIVVTINYRLGLLGFLSLEDPTLDVPGNAAMKDMVLALKWVQHNIKYFNGNPENVTIFGQSAGGAAGHLLMLSPMTKGLFHRVIAQSGCALNPWIDGIYTTTTLQKLLKLDGCDERTLLKTLQDYTVAQVHELQETIIDHLGSRSYGIVVEKNCRDPFLPEQPIDIITSKKFHQVPFMVGYTTAEGMCFELFRYPNPNFEEDIPAFFGDNLDSDDNRKLIEKIRHFYYGENGLPINNRTKKHTMDTDLMFLYGIYCSARKHAALSDSPVYFYRISLQTSLNIFKEFLKIKEPGTSHCDDLGYLFKNFAFKTKLDSDALEFIYIKRFIKLWTNFARYGNPTPHFNNYTININNNNDECYLDVDWEPVRVEDMNFLNIGSTLTMMSNPEPERMKFWDSLYSSSTKRANYCLEIN